MKIANKPLNSQALALEIAETKIRQIVKTEYLKRTPRQQIDTLVKKVIFESIKQIKITELRKATIISLTRFYNQQYDAIKSLFNGDIVALLAIILLNNKSATYSEKNKAINTLRAKGFIPKMGANIYGQANNEYINNYMKKVAETMDKMAKMQPKDPHDTSGRNTLRNRAEMEVRYQGHLDNIAKLKAEGHKLVIASTHADCSKRCSEWQGKVYSLDGTYGKTDDGRDFVPLEVATDVFYHTNAGKTYKNGLLGFNCRHYLIAYKSGFHFPQPNEKKERKERKITAKQRYLERNVRYWRDVAIEKKDIDKDEYLIAREKAIEWNNKYIKFSQQHNRAYYPSRTKVI